MSGSEMSGEIKLQGFLLKKQPLGEADELITVFSRERGKLRVKAVSVKKSSSRLLGNLQALSEVSLRLVGNGSLYKVAGAVCVKDYKAIKQSEEKIHFFYWLAETVIKSTPDEEPDDNLYKLISYALERLEVFRGTGSEMRVFLCYTIIRLMEVLGFAVNLKHLPGEKVSQQMLEDFDLLENSRSNTLPNNLKSLEELQEILFRYVAFQLERKIHSTSLFV